MSGKRSAGHQLTRENEHNGSDDEEGDQLQRAPETVLSRRKIAKPRARRTAGNTGQGASAPAAPSNPFGTLGGAASAAATTPAAAAAAPNPFASVGNGSNSTSNGATNGDAKLVNPSQATPLTQESSRDKADLTQWFSLNEKFAEVVAMMARECGDQDWTKTLQKYLDYAKQIHDGTLTKQKNNNTEAVPAKTTQPASTGSMFGAAATGPSFGSGSTLGSSTPAFGSNVATFGSGTSTFASSSSSTTFGSGFGGFKPQTETPPQEEEDQKQKQKDSEQKKEEETKSTSGGFKPDLTNAGKSPFQFNSTSTTDDSSKAGSGFKFTGSTGDAGDSVFKVKVATEVPQKDEAKEQQDQPKSLFGSSSTQSKPLFGSSTTPTTSSSSEQPNLFGSQGQESNSPFGSAAKGDDSKQTPFGSTGGFSFGQSSSKASPFGNSESKEKTNSTPFGGFAGFGSSASTTDSSSANKGTESGDKPAASLFGSSSSATSTNAPAPFKFGAASTTSDSASQPLFGSSAAPAFGSSSQSGSAFSFNSQAPTTGATSTASESTPSKPAFSFGSNSSPTTWTPDKGIKFGDTSGSEAAAKQGVGLFGSTPSTTGLFGSGSGSAPGSTGLFGNSQQQSTTAASESNNDGGEEEGQVEAQQGDLSEKGPGEENEDVVFEQKSKLFKLVDGQFKVEGLGQLRVLTHKETKKTRALIRAEGSGRVVLNIAIRKEIDYKLEGKNQVRLVDFDPETKKPVNYLVRVKNAEDAQKLRSVLEAEKQK